MARPFQCRVQGQNTSPNNLAATEQGAKACFTREGVFMPILLSIDELVATAIIARVFFHSVRDQEAVREQHLAGNSSYSRCCRHAGLGRLLSSGKIMSSLI